MEATAADVGRRILVVDDEPLVGDVVARYLRRDGFDVVVVRDGAAALQELRRHPPALVVLDVLLPGLDGREVLSRIREERDTPVILLTALGAEPDRVRGLELGADDYLVKPFSPRELAARVRSVLRRAAGPAAPEVRIFDGLEIDLRGRRVTVHGRPVDLTRKEFDLLALLSGAPGRVFTREQLLAQVWTSSSRWQDPATVRVHVGQVRRKIEDDATEPRWIATVWGVGYRFDA